MLSFATSTEPLSIAGRVAQAITNVANKIKQICCNPCPINLPLRNNKRIENKLYSNTLISYHPEMPRLLQYHAGSR